VTVKGSNKVQNYRILQVTSYLKGAEKDIYIYIYNSYLIYYLVA